MRRAGIFIGVDRTGNLPELQDAAAGARRMHQWALGQGMPDGTHAKLITDTSGPVGPDQIYEAIRALADGPGVDQLIVYFAGHGINLNLSEIWLLSEAPVRADAAVDLNASLETARDGAIPHVVFISDACRVAPRGAQAQRVRGHVIFPNDPTGQSRTIDRFFACAPTRTAAEIRHPEDLSAGYVAVYTSVLLDALDGNAPEVLEALDETQPSESAGARYVRGPRLKKYLASSVPERIAALGLVSVDQDPDAIVEGHDSWLSRVVWDRRLAPVIGQPFAPAPPNLRDLAASVVANTLGHEPTAGTLVPTGQDDFGIPGAAEFLREVEALATPLEALSVPSRCGVRVRGRRITQVQGAAEAVSATDGHVVEVNLRGLGRPGASLLMSFEDGSGTLVPVIRDMITSLTFGASGGIVDVAFDHARGGRFARLSTREAVRMARRRAATAVASDRGFLRPDADQMSRLLGATVNAEHLDPTLVLYSAYVSHDGGGNNWVRIMSDRLTDQFGATFMDLELLSRRPVSRDDVMTGGVLPGLPLLSRGWSVVRGRGLHLIAEQEALRSSLLDSQWSLYDPAGCDVLSRAMRRGEI